MLCLTPCLIGVSIWTILVRGSYPYCWSSYTKDFHTIGERIPYFPIFGLINIAKFVIVHKINKIRKDIRNRLYNIIYIPKTLLFVDYFQLDETGYFMFLLGLEFS